MYLNTAKSLIGRAIHIDLVDGSVYPHVVLTKIITNERRGDRFRTNILSRGTLLVFGKLVIPIKSVKSFNYLPGELNSKQILRGKPKGKIPACFKPTLRGKSKSGAPFVYCPDCGFKEMA